MVDYIPVSEVKNMRTGINVKGKIKSKEDPRTVNLKNGTSTIVCDMAMEDETGGIKLTLWGADVNNVEVGDMVDIENGYTSEFKGEISLTKGKFGKLKIIKPELQ